MSQISPLAYINSNAKIGNGTQISPFAFIDANVTIGENCWIAPNSTILNGTVIGDNCKVFPGAVVGAIPQDLKFKGEKTTVIIGDNVTIRECVTINRGTAANEKTVIGNNCLLMAYVHIAHDCEIGNQVIIANSVNLAGHILIEDFVVIEGMVAIQQFVKVGKHAFISGGSLVRKDVPPYVRAAREPLSYIGINSIGLRRRGFEREIIHSIQDVYRVLFVKGFSTSKALNIINTELPPSKERDEIVKFVSESVRGVMKGFRTLNGN